jgi:hypothetical protein
MTARLEQWSLRAPSLQGDDLVHPLVTLVDLGQLIPHAFAGIARIARVFVRKI